MTTLVRKASVSLAIPVYKTSMPTRYAAHTHRFQKELETAQEVVSLSNCTVLKKTVGCI